MGSRRDFLKKSGLLLGAGLTLPVLSTLITSCNKNEGAPVNSISSIDVNLTSYPALNTDGGSASVTVPGFNYSGPVIIIRKGTDYNVLSGVCPHEGCFVDPPPFTNNEIVCRCHFSYFNASSGAYIKGPARTGLTQLTYKLNGDIMTIS